MWKIRDLEIPKTKYRLYSPTSMRTAFSEVKTTGEPIRKVARKYGVPEASLRHKLSGRVNPEAVRSGSPALFSQEEEARLANHLKFTASVGYGYSRSEVLDIATEYAISLGYRDNNHPLSFGWYEGFKSRWPDLKLLKSRGLEIQRAKATTMECVKNYYTELGRVLTKYDLHNKPERIYNVDEKGLSTSHKPPQVIASTGTKPPCITSNSRVTVTVLGCGNALGYPVPPFFVFPGTRMRQELLEGKSSGADGTVSESGWSNSEVFRRYLESHLMRYLPVRTADLPVLLLFDGHRSHVNLNLIEWARKQHIILFVLPAHTSHVLQPMDVGCFGPYQKIFNELSHKYMREHCGQSITKYNICALGCAAYTNALSVVNLQSAFQKSGIHPFNPDAVDCSNFKVAEVQEQAKPEETGSCHDNVDPSTNHVALSTNHVDPSTNHIDSSRHVDTSINQVDPCSTNHVDPPTRHVDPCSSNVGHTSSHVDPSNSHVDPSCSHAGPSSRFFSEKEKPIKVKKIPTKKRRLVSTIVSGQAITEEIIINKIIEHQQSVNPPKKSALVRDPCSSKSTKAPLPGPSGLKRTKRCRQASKIADEQTIMSDVSSEEDEKCCVCNKFSPDAVRQSTSIIFVKWVKCDQDGCDHWVHLKYCTKINVVRRGDKFFCQHCSPEE